MLRPWLLAALPVLGGCVHERVLAVGRSYLLSVIAGDGQSASAGSTLPHALVVGVRDASGAPVKAAVVVFRVMAGAADGAAMVDSIAVTDDAGEAESELRLGSRAGAVVVQAFPSGADDRTVTFRATATGGPVLAGVLPVNVGPGDTLVLAGSALGGLTATVEIGTARVHPVSGGDGELRAVVPDCLSEGSINVRVLSGTAWTASRPVTYAGRRRPIALRPYESVVIGAVELASCASLATEANAEFIVIPQFASQAATPVQTMVRVAAGTATTAAALFGTSAAGRAIRESPSSAQDVLDAALRDMEWRLAPMARAEPVSHAPMHAQSLETLRLFHVIVSLAGDSTTHATGRLRFTGAHVAIYVDTVTPAAFSDAELDRMGRLYDTDLYRVVTTAFGPEPDIDHNGRVLIFLTPRVNALVAAGDCGLRGFVTGFFHGRDLLTTVPHSNAGELYYGMVPDSTARFSCAHTSADVQILMQGTFVHEFQHLVSFFQHVLARGGNPEETWVNEGLSHIAEELASRLFEARYPAPLGRSTATQLFPDSASPFIKPQMLNAYVYLNSSSGHSVTTFGGSGSLEERGAVWLFLRWLGDQKGEAIYRRLVQTSLTGMANVEAKAGEPFARLFGDFATAIWADSIPGVPRSAVAPRYRFASRNLRQLMAREATISEWPDPFPFTPLRIWNTGSAEGPLMPGSMVYLRMGPFGAVPGHATLSFRRTDGVAFAGTEGAQVSVLRVR